MKFEKLRFRDNDNLSGKSFKFMKIVVFRLKLNKYKRVDFKGSLINV